MNTNAHSHELEEGQLGSPPMGEEGEEGPVVCNGASLFPCISFR
jgi:hypothetical protein